MKNCFRMHDTPAWLQEKLQNCEPRFSTSEGKERMGSMQKLEFKKRIDPEKIKVRSKGWKRVETSQNFQ